MPKKKAKTGTVTARENACEVTLKPLLTHVVTGPAVLPPGAADDWDCSKLGGTKCGAIEMRGNNQLGLYTLGPNVLSRDECNAWIEFGESRGFEEVGHPEGGGYAHRSNGRILVLDEEIAEAIWLRVRAFVPADLQDGTGRRPVGCASNLRLYRYRSSTGDRFGKHVDGSNHDEATGNSTEYTLLLYLNGGGPDDDLRGGETVFYTGPKDNEVCGKFEPRRGWCLFHRHGEHCLTHEGALVTNGVKYLLRTDVVFGE